MLEKIKAEPARVVALVITLIAVLSAFGLGITSGQSDAVVALVGAGLSLIGGEVTRSQVRPASKSVPAPAAPSSTR